MITRLASYVVSGVALVALSVACSSPTDSRSQNGGLGTDAGTGGSPGGASGTGGSSSQNGGASNGGRAGGGTSAGGNAGSGNASTGGVGGAAAGGSPAAGGNAGTAGVAGSGGSTGGASNAGGASADAGPCNHCLPTYDLHWGQNGGLVAWVETSRLGPCANYSHERTPTFTDPPSLICNVTISMCLGSPLAQIVDVMGTAEFNAALTGHTLYGNDPRPVDGQVFRISIGNDFIDVGPNCESDQTSCPSMPEPVRRLVTLLRDLDAATLAVEPCKSVFGN